MKKFILISFAAILPVAAFAADPSLNFHVVPLEGFSGNSQFEHRVIPYRFFDTMTVVVEDPDHCGQKPINARFAIENGKLTLGYDLTPFKPGAESCLIVSQFDITGLPHKSLDVAFAGGDEPYTVVKLKKCEFYQPISSDIYECLAPAKDPNAK